MKKILFLCLLFAATALRSFAQSPLEVFDRQIDSIYLADKRASEAENYALSEKINLSALALYESQTQAVKDAYTEMYNDNLRGTYFALACAQSRLKKRSQAIENLTKAYELGFDYYDWVSTDPDLENIRNEKGYRHLLTRMRETSDYLYILQQAPAYAPNERTDTLPHFTYMAPNDRNLVGVRERFKLDSVAGSGDELSKILNLLTFVHNTIPHDGMNGIPEPRTTMAMVDSCRLYQRGLNCRGLAIVLNDCYLAMGFKSRFVTCMPKVYIDDCHVINAVYSTTLDKWLWVDPTNNAWVTDENGTMLGIAEVRERLRDGHPLRLNEEANWNNQQKITQEKYLDNYMAKNLYCLICVDASKYGAEVKVNGAVDVNYYGLTPTGARPRYDDSDPHFVTDDSWFWQSPYDN